jgi:hypothetical protein
MMNLGAWAFEFCWSSKKALGHVVRRGWACGCRCHSSANVTVPGEILQRVFTSLLALPCPHLLWARSTWLARKYAWERERENGNCNCTHTMKGTINELAVSLTLPSRASTCTRSDLAPPPCPSLQSNARLRTHLVARCVSVSPAHRRV